MTVVHKKYHVEGRTVCGFDAIDATQSFKEY